MPPKKIATVIKSLEDSLPVKAGRTHNVIIGEFTFRHLPLYEGGGQILHQLLNQYKEHNSNCRVDKHIFSKIAKGMTKKG